MTIMLMWARRLFGKRHLLEVESLLKRAVANQEKIMSVLDELKMAIADVAKDAASMKDEVAAALDHILKSVPDVTPDLQEAVNSVKDIHASLADSFQKLKDKVDSVSASGGDAG